MIANIAPEMRFYADTVNTLNFASKSRTMVNQPFVRRTIGECWIKISQLSITPVFSLCYLTSFFPQAMIIDVIYAAINDPTYM